MIRFLVEGRVLAQLFYQLSLADGAKRKRISNLVHNACAVDWPKAFSLRLLLGGKVASDGSRRAVPFLLHKCAGRFYHDTFYILPLIVTCISPLAGRSIW